MTRRPIRAIARGGFGAGRHARAISSRPWLRGQSRHSPRRATESIPHRRRSRGPRTAVAFGAPQPRAPPGAESAFDGGEARPTIARTAAEGGEIDGHLLSTAARPAVGVSARRAPRRHERVYRSARRGVPARERAQEGASASANPNEKPGRLARCRAHEPTAHEGQSRDCVPERHGIGSRARYADGLRGMHPHDIPMTSGAETR